MPSCMLKHTAILKSAITAKMEDFYIQSLQNDQVKNLVKLRERKYRDRQSRFLVEGLREIKHALTAGYKIINLYYCPDFFPSASHLEFIDSQKDQTNLSVIRMSAEAFKKGSYREGPDGLIAVAIQQNNPLDDLKLSKDPILLILEGIEKPGNLGAILRSADGAGADAVILVDCVLDIYNPNAIRSSQGLLFSLPLVLTDREPLTEWLEANKIACYATTPETRTIHWDKDYRQGTAFIMGSEREGLSPYWLERSDHSIRLPMIGQADSLNVAAAAAVCLYEARRQRS